MRQDRHGSTLGETFKAILAETGRRHQDDHWDFKVPSELRYVLGWFWELQPDRPVGPSGILGIPSAAIQAWCSLRRLRLERWEFEALRGLDVKFLEVMGERDG